MANKIIHFEVVGRDAPALVRFYSDLLGWSFNTDNPGGYGMTTADETGVVAGIGPSPDGGQGWVTGYVSVPDIDAVLARVTDLGGTVVMPKFNPGGGATLAMFADPEGHVIGLSAG
jgi:predicted enzyme related to lactoylglutathione lyase